MCRGTAATRCEVLTGIVLSSLDASQKIQYTLKYPSSIFKMLLNKTDESLQVKFMFMLQHDNQR